MSLEIERKFLVTSLNFKEESIYIQTIKQGFLNTDKNRVVRIRTCNTKAYITVKGKTNAEGTTRFEWEKEILLKEATQLLLLCEPTIIEKNRYLVKKGNHTFEIDEFLGENKGLIVAEVELNKADEYFEKPVWLGKEVTGDLKYYNAVLSKNPYTKWPI
ncbi:CYTH domain-containing protein [Polaribacter tangerinus]|uniref:CYTH domain-containing protein n=1 Tax=Polaribacter tangerinus TaxID=1920034 RepID=UPI000B4BE248|nr:CYTH domain-containing protein [Polaribacter tangerinus]